MQATDTFTLRISPQEKAMLADVAKRLQRSKADTLKIFIRREFAAIKIEKGDGANLSESHKSTPGH